MTPSITTDVPSSYRSNELDIEIFLVNFVERRTGEVRSIHLPGTSVNKGEKKGRSRARCSRISLAAIEN
jgi:hypothetical protein